MTRSLTPRLVSLAFGALLAACRPEFPAAPSGQPSFAVDEGPVGRDAFPWSEPVWLGPVVNSPAADWRPNLSADGHRLYFHSERAGGLGGFDIWVSRRARHDCPWQAPENLGAPVNTAGGDGDAEFTPDGHVLFFGSTGHGGAGLGDIFISRRSDPNDDLAWQTPINLGSDVNTAAHESNPAYVANEDGGVLYFNRSVGGIPRNGDIYRVALTRDGETRGPAVLLSELSAPGIADGAATVSTDGRELIFWSGGAAGTRPGGVGLADLWSSTRRSVNDAWSPPRNLGRPVNSEGSELSATLSHDGRTLFFTAGAELGGLGRQDMWMSTRGPSGDAAAGNETLCGS